MRFLMMSWRDPFNPRAGGAERVSQAYMSELARRGHDAYWFSNEFPNCRRQEELDGVRIVRRGELFKSVLNARNWCKRQPGFDLIIDQHHGIPWFAPWWSGTNCVAYIHEVLGPVWDIFYGWPLNKVGKSQEFCCHWLYRNVPFWVPSESTRRALLARGVKNVMVIPNGIDPITLCELQNKTLGQPLRLCVVTRLAPNKRVGHAIRLVRLLVDRGIETRLNVVGRGEDEPNLKDVIKRQKVEDKVFFLGKLDEEEKLRVLSESHLLVHTSICEGWGLNVIEANAMGTPAVVYPAPGLIDSTVDGVTGIVCAAQTPESMACGIERVLNNPEFYYELRRNAWSRSKEFHWRNVLAKACDWLETQAQTRQVK
ncbi:MAG: glycosyltransferase family 4 protein [Verrucomicrobia bacterium]|nr:glycosyltransferase family 4 protein [Verrucomicrobiota bacterium]MCF7708921.1 glycosyltransferase family 4 protein [Verrucomicrobiota bacterium]